MGSANVFDLTEIEAFLDSLQVGANELMAAHPGDPVYILAARLEPMRKIAILEFFRAVNQYPSMPGHQVAAVYSFVLGASAGEVLGALGRFGIRTPLIPDLIDTAVRVATKAMADGEPEAVIFETKPVQ